MRKRNTVAAVFFMGCAVVLAGCKKQPAQTVWFEQVEEIVIPARFRVDPAANISDNQDFTEEFNRAYKGRYRLNVEWIAESSQGYRNKLKQWNVLDDMPAIITDAAFDYDFYQLLVKEGRLVDLKPYMEQSEFWMDAMNKEILAECTYEDGSVYLAPLGSSAFTYAGIIYQEELLAKAGYDEFPQTWDEFFACLDALKAAEITPLALHGSDSYWIPMLFATAYMQTTKQGREFLTVDFPDSYQNESMEQMLQILCRLYEYTFDDALQLDCNQAMERFLEGEAAILANGRWMFENLDETYLEKLKFTFFPGEVLMNSPKTGAWAVCAGYEKDVTEGAVKALEFRILCEQKSTEELLLGGSHTLLEKSYAETVKNAGLVMPNYQIKWEQDIQNEFFTEQIPELLNENVDIKEFLAMMDDELKKIQAKK